MVGEEHDVAGGGFEHIAVDRLGLSELSCHGQRLRLGSQRTVEIAAGLLEVGGDLDGTAERDDALHPIALVHLNDPEVVPGLQLVGKPGDEILIPLFRLLVAARGGQRVAPV